MSTKHYIIFGYTELTSKRLLSELPKIEGLTDLHTAAKVKLILGADHSFQAVPFWLRSEATSRDGRDYFTSLPFQVAACADQAILCDANGNRIRVLKNRHSGHTIPPMHAISGLPLAYIRKD